MNTGTLAEIDVRQLNRVVAVMTYGRAGSGLMSSLLDGHPNVLTTPDCLMMGYFEFWEKHGHLAAGELVAMFIDYYALLFDARTPSKCGRTGPDIGEYLNLTRLGRDQDECLSVDREIFRQKITGIIGEDHQVSRRLFFQALHVAYAATQGRRVTNPIISFGLHIAHPLAVRRLVDDFPEAIFLQMVRHPIQVVGSVFRMRYLRGEIHPSLPLNAIQETLFYGTAVPREDGARWRGVRLEDLHQNPNDTMEKVCRWLNIPWDETVLESTVNGAQWWNEKNSPQISGTGDAIVSQSFEEYIPPLDRFRLSVLLAPKCEPWGYEVNPWHRGIFARLLVLAFLFVPFKMELISIGAVKTSLRKDRLFLRRIVALCRAIYPGRKVLLRIWLRKFRGRDNQVKLL